MKKITMILFATLLMVSCGEKSEDKKEEKTSENSQKERTEEELVQYLDSISSAFKNGTIQKEEANKAVNQYAANATILSNKHPENKKAPAYLDEVAMLVDNFLGKPEQAFKIYNLIIANHPNYVDLDKVMYLKAIVLDVSLNKLDQAEKAYNEMLDKFPDSQYAESVRGRLKNIDKTFEEVTAESANQPL